MVNIIKLNAAVAAMQQLHRFYLGDFSSVCNAMQINTLHTHNTYKSHVI